MNLLSAGQTFYPYGLSHWVILLGVAAGAMVLVRFGRKNRHREHSVMFERVFAVVLLVFALTMLVYDLLPAQWHVDSSLPLHLSDLAWMAAVYALWTRSQWAFSLTYYWGLTLNTQAMITPAVRPGFPDLDFISYWTQHTLVVWAAIYLTWGLGMRPNWCGYTLTVAATILWGAAAFGFNLLAGTNYGFLNAKPPGASILDLMGDWPWYLARELAIALALWALITWPWTRNRWAISGAQR